MGIPEIDGRDVGTEEIFEKNSDTEFLQVNIRLQSTDPGSSENTKQKKIYPPQKKKPQKNLLLDMSFSKLQKIKDK